MNPTDLEHIRLSLLRHLDANPTRWGLTVPLLSQMLRAEGQEAPERTLQAELDYLVEKGLVTEVGKPISPENRAWRLSAAGRDFLAQRRG